MPGPSGCMGDTQYHFRIRCSGPGAGGTSLKFSSDHIGAPLVLTVSNSSTDTLLVHYWYIISKLLVHY